MMPLWSPFAPPACRNWTRSWSSWPFRSYFGWSPMSNEIPAKYYHSLHLLSTFTHVICISILSYLIAKREPLIHKLHPTQWKHLTWGKVCAFLVMVFTWTFIFFSGIFMTGVGTTGNPESCAAVILICFILLNITKALNHAFLVEKVYIIWSSGCSTPRFETKVYKICSVSLLVYFGMAIDGFVRYRTSYITEGGGCVFGYKGIAAFLLETYNLLQNAAFALMFVWPLWHSRVTSPRLRAIAKKTLYGTLGGVMMSSVNAIALLVLGGTELAWMCMTFCVLEATLNAWILDWVNSESGSSLRKHRSLTEIEITAASKAANLTNPNTGPSVRDELIQERSDITDDEDEQGRQDHLNLSAGRRYSV
ncbi:hypothetical protein WG66_004033 [Moniliophthora roreri]|nr:hypothetical protein WG66_004033 [Moniliophthora roreri]